MWYRTGKLVKVRRAFRAREGYHSKNLPNINTLRNIIDKFEVFGTIKDRRRSVDNSRVGQITRKEIMQVHQCYIRKQKLSIRKASKQLKMTRYKVRKILKRVLRKRAFKPQTFQKLTPSQKLRRVTDLKSLLKINQIRSILNRTWFTDESYFTTDGIVHKRNQFYWAINKDDVDPVIVEKFPVKLHVWAAVSSRGVIGPYFFHQNGKNVSVTADKYQ